MSITRKLSESLENMYKLNEAFDESVPDWLKKALGATAPHTYTPKGVKGTDDPNEIYKGKFRTTSYSFDKDNKYYYPGSDSQKPKGTAEFGYKHEKDFLANQFLENGVDISTMKVHEAPIPKSVPRDTKNNHIIPIFLMDNGQVWAKGYNDREKYRPWDIIFKAMSSKDIIEHAAAYCYIDKNDAAVKDNPVTNKRQRRKMLLDELKRLENYFTTSPLRGYEYHDKSGYTISFPSSRNYSRKYWDKVDDIKNKKASAGIPAMIEQIKDDAVEVVETIKNAVSDISLDADSEFLKSCEYAISDLRELQDYIQEAENRFAQYDAFNDLDYVGEAKDYITKAKNKLEHVQQSMQKYKQSIVDW